MLPRALSGFTNSSKSETSDSKTGVGTAVLGVNELLFDELALDNVNLFALLAWVVENKLVQKLNGFVQVTADREERETKLHQLQEGNKCLNLTDASTTLYFFRKFAKIRTHETSLHQLQERI